MKADRRKLIAIPERGPIPPRSSATGYPLGDMRLWGMTGHLAGAYAPGSVMHGRRANREGRGRPTGGNEDGLSVRAIRGPLPAPSAARTLDRQAGPRRGGLRHLSPSVARLYLLALRDPDLRDRLHAGRRPHRLRLVLGDPRRPARRRSLDDQLHAEKPDPRGTVRPNPHEQTGPTHGG